MVWIFLGFLWVLCGVVGAVIAANKRASGGLGFTLGLLFGPIGLIVAALLSPSENPDRAGAPSPSNAAATKPPTEANLQNAQYKVWLIETYCITRNEVLGEFVCGENSFNSIDDALHFAHSEETKKRVREEEERRQREAERQAERERLLELQAEEDAKNRRLAKWVAISLVVILLGASPFIYQSLSAAAEMQKAREAAKEARALEILSELGLDMGEMSDFDVRLSNSQFSCDGKRGIEYTFYTSDEVRQRVRQMISGAGRELPYSNTEGYISKYVVNANPYYPLYFTVCDIGAEMPGPQL